MESTKVDDGAGRTRLPRLCIVDLRNNWVPTDCSVMRLPNWEGSSHELCVPALRALTVLCHGDCSLYP